MEVRVRFAPSPTGYLHVGGLRTALYNYLFACKHSGKMILRIEDTDRNRFVDNAIENLIKSLKWAGIEYDEGPDKSGEFGPYIQSERLEIYRKYALELVNNGFAYYAFDTAEEIESMRKMSSETFGTKYNREAMKNQYTIGMEQTKKLIDSGMDYVIRLKVSINEEVSFVDRIRGEVKVSTNDIDDQVLLKSDGYPTYHLANVVDDHFMKITHVIRGEEWLPSTPKHILLYNYFGWEIPEFAHLPLLLNKDKSKLSKRQGSVAVEDFRSKGYLRDAFVNFIALLGWNPTGDREIYKIEELIEYFNIEKVNKGGAVFDIQKLDWMNQQYIKSTPSNEFVQELTEYVQQHFNKKFDEIYIEKVINLFKERITFIHDILQLCPYMFSDIISYEHEYMTKKWISVETDEIMNNLLEIYKSTDSFTHDILAGITKEFALSIGKKLGDIIHPIRLIITGQPTGAGMFETMEILGKELCIIRFEKFLSSKPYLTNAV